MVSLEILVLAVFTIIMAIAALETEKISRAIAFLALSAFGIGSIFFVVGAIYAAMLEYFLYGGALVILFMAAASFTKREEEESPNE
ncbi:MAG: hypothetical protein ACFFC7_04435 [Candidatus Hermodarchaeota archaeon]